MSIDFRCGSIVKFDSQQKKYLTCSERLSVDDSMAGMQVECPACGNSVDVPLLRPAETLAGQSPDEQIFSESYELRKDDVVKRENTIDHARFTRANTCEACGASIAKANDVCPQCKAPLPADLRKTKPPLAFTHPVTGFQLWCRNLLTSNSSKSSGAAVPVIQAGAALVMGLLCVTLIMFAGLLGFVLALPLLLATVFYVLAALKWREMQRKPLAKLSWWQRPAWNGLLKLNRILKWKNPLAQGIKLTVLDQRYRLVTDHDLFDLDGIKHAHVLDLEGQPVTDEGLLYLHRRIQLKFIVLRRTKVTDEGVFHLQQAIPRAWIWH